MTRNNIARAALAALGLSGGVKERARKHYLTEKHEERDRQEQDAIAGKMMAKAELKRRRKNERRLAQQKSSARERSTRQ